MISEINIVGSVPLESPEAVFRALGTGLRGRVKRLPDGETGPLRSKWILCQFPVFKQHPAFEVLSEEEARKCNVTPVGLPPVVRLKSSSVSFEDLGYARWAEDSYAVFARLKQQGVIEQSCRLQVCVPTPFAVVNRAVNPDDHAAVFPAYHAAMRREIERMLQAIPHGEFCLQLDVCHEVGIWEGVFVTHQPNAKQALLEQVGELASLVPAGADLGYHICYGDFGHKHFVEPKDAGVLTAIANALRKLTRRRIDYIQMPVPRGRHDEAFFEPLRGLALDRETALFLGLVHATDGIAGALRRIAAAERFVADFGIATECGWGRRDPASIPGLIALHADILRSASKQ
jgi:hypothetical protein